MKQKVCSYSGPICEVCYLWKKALADDNSVAQIKNLHFYRR